MLKMFSTFALLLGWHDAVHCHCHRHFLPSPQTKRNQFVVHCVIGAVAAIATGWLLYHLIAWACSLPGTMRIGSHQ